MTRPLLTAAAVPLALALTVSACGGSSTTTASTGADDASSSAAGNPSATGGPPVSPTSAPASPSGDFLEITRSGGIAGVRDIVRVATDGTAKLLSRDGRTRNCTPPAADVRRLRAMDLAALAAQPSGAAVADGFVFSVRTPTGSAAVGDGNESGRRAQVLDAAATVVAACLAGTPTSGETVR